MLLEVTERNQVKLSESNHSIGYQVLVHNEVNLKNEESILWLMIHLVDLEGLDVTPLDSRSNI